jgi:hypothetical protein
MCLNKPNEGMATLWKSVEIDNNYILKAGADPDFQRHQAAMDAYLEERLAEIKSANEKKRQNLKAINDQFNILAEEGCTLWGWKEQNATERVFVEDKEAYEKGQTQLALAQKEAATGTLKGQWKAWRYYKDAEALLAPCLADAVKWAVEDINCTGAELTKWLKRVPTEEISGKGGLALFLGLPILLAWAGWRLTSHHFLILLGAIVGGFFATGMVSEWIAERKSKPARKKWASQKPLLEEDILKLGEKRRKICEAFKLENTYERQFILHRLDASDTCRWRLRPIKGYPYEYISNPHQYLAGHGKPPSFEN